MKLTREQVRLLAATVDLRIPDKDLDNVTIRLSSLLSSMEAIEAELGEQMNAVEPLPPVFPPEDYK
jgi:hypothetical protein